jgi:hypothetical protein
MLNKQEEVYQSFYLTMLDFPTGALKQLKMKMSI